MQHLSLSAIPLNPAGAQNRGRDASKFKLLHFEAHGEWEIFCGHFGSDASRFCELRRTDVFSRKPFRAMVSYIRYGEDGPRIRLDTERSTVWLGGGLMIDGALAIGLNHCTIGGCAVGKDGSAAFLNRLSGAQNVAVKFRILTSSRIQNWDRADLSAGVAALGRLRKKYDLP